MSSLPPNTQSVAFLFKEHIVSGAYSNPARRDEYRLNTIYASYDTDAVEAVTVALEVCGRSPTKESDWVVLQAAAALPFHLVLPEGMYFAIRAKRNATTRPITVMINSGGHTRT